jgi:hypothetical protein
MTQSATLNIKRAIKYNNMISILIFLQLIWALFQLNETYKFEFARESNELGTELSEFCGLTARLTGQVVFRIHN